MRRAVLFLVLLLSINFTTVAGATPELSGSNVGINGDGLGASLALNSYLSAAFAYFSALSHSLRFAEAIGSDWQLTDIDTGLSTVASVTVDSQFSYNSPVALVYVSTVPHIVYYDIAGARLVHAYRPNGAWIKETIVGGLYSGGAPSVVACGTALCMSFYNGASRTLQFARGMAGAWTVSTIDSQVGVGAMNSIAIKPNGLAAVVYYDSVSRRPKAAVQTNQSAWSISTLSFVDHSFGIYPSITSAADGTLYASFSRYQRSNSAVDLGLYLAKLSVGGSWTVAEIATDYTGGPNQIRVDKSGRLAIAARYRRKNSQYGTASGVRYLTFDSAGTIANQYLSGEFGFSGSSYDYDSVQLAFSDDSPNVGYGFTYLTGTPSSNRALRLHRVGSNSVGGTSTTTIPVPTSSTVATSSTVPPVSTTTTTIIHSTTTTLPVTTTTSTTPRTTTTSVTTTSSSIKSSSTTTSRSTTTTSILASTTYPVLRINSGGNSVTDPTGARWTGDSLYLGGETYSKPVPIFGTVNDAVYQSQRSGTSFRYSIPAVRGIYRIRLHFAELTATRLGQRVFNVVVEGASGLSKFDILRESVAGSAVVKTFYSTVTDNAIDIGFSSVTGAAVIAGIEIQQLSVDGLLINTGGGTETSADGRTWIADLGFTGGATINATGSITGTDSQAVAQSMRLADYTYGYRLPVPNGNYDLVFHFVEPSAQAPGMRVFDCKVEGVAQIKALDIFKLVGRNRDLVVTTSVNVKDGELNLDLSPVYTGHKSVISALELHRIP